MAKKQLLLFVHGWSVTDTDTYGGLPERLRTEAAGEGIDLAIKDVYLGKYISFHDEVRVGDIARGFEKAVREELADDIDAGRRFACITHSTGGPVVREWWHRYYDQPGVDQCPMSHLIMLAPANFGSALAQLGKGRLSRMKFATKGVEPGQGVLDWLELGSQEAWALNQSWIQTKAKSISSNGVFPFVLTGQSIDRKFYDNLNTYTGEDGSDGVVRVAAANLNARYLRLEQVPIGSKKIKHEGFVGTALKFKKPVAAPETACLVVAGKSHSGEDMGIMRSIQQEAGSGGEQVIQPILDCLKVRSKQAYKGICKSFAIETEKVQKKEKIEIQNRGFWGTRHFIHDRYAMVVFRVHDDQGYPVTDYDLMLTTGEDANPNQFPKGFLPDCQRNRVSPESITFYFNYDLMVKGSDKLVSGDEVIREKGKGVKLLGLRVIPRPDNGFVRYTPCELKVAEKIVKQALVPNSTTLIDIVIRREVGENVMVLEKKAPSHTNPKGRFDRTLPGDPIRD